MVREIREKLGWTQTELAKRSGVRQGVLSDIENGVTKDPRIGTMAALASAMNVPIEALLKKGDEEC